MYVCIIIFSSSGMPRSLSLSFLIYKVDSVSLSGKWLMSSSGEESILSYIKVE